MSFRERAVVTLQALGLDLSEHAEEMIPDAQNIKSVNVWISIPSLTDDPDNIPEIEVSVEMYPDRKTYRMLNE